jgi:hypothetical protein
LLRLQAKLVEKDKVKVGDGGDGTEVVGLNRTAEWVERHSRDGLGRGSGSGRRKSKGRGAKKLGKGDGDGDGESDGGGWDGDVENVEWG